MADQLASVLTRSRAAALALLAALVAGCATNPPRNIDSICAIFAEKRGWRAAADRSAQRWGTPVHVQMAIVHQESGFRHDAKPPKKSRFLGVIPRGRASSAYGYPQAKDETWRWYIRATGNRGADRDNFADAIDFVGWYTAQSQQMAGISKWDPYNQYLAYHEGQGGFKRGSYRNKQWLQEVARKVDYRAKEWGVQLKRCP